MLALDGGDANIAKSSSKTPLHVANIAKSRGHTDIVRLLLSHDGIDDNIANNDGDEPRRNGHTEIVSMLLSRA